jgi:small-conductance mechanosensitive channel
MRLEYKDGYNYRGVPCNAGNLPELAMVTDLAASRTDEHTALRRMLGRARFLSLLILLGVLAMCLGLSWTTRDAMVHLPFLNGQKPQHDLAASSQSTIVDLHPWQIAQALTPLAVSREEVEYAHEAERLADHEVNQAFATSLRQAGAQHNAPTGEAIELSQKVTQLQQMVKDDQGRVRSLTPAPGAQANGGGDDDLKIAQAQLDLDVDELNDAEHDLARASGDVRTRIEQELAAHQTAMSKMNAQSGSDSQIAVLSTRQYGTLAHRIDAWFNQRSRYQLIQQAAQQARADAANLTKQHNALEALADAGSAAAASPGASRPDAATLASLQRRREERQLLTIYDDRIQTQQQLAGVYSKWANQVLLQHRIVAHLGLRSLAMVAFILICVILCESVGTRLLERHAFDRRRMQTLRTILRLSVQLVGVLCVLLVTFGVPSQISTILGLATAGLTVALQSFILAFFGWFILMGKNGIRVGDWVEINGVAGEVAEINLFRTTILETRSWADKGHPTGRRATFINNFAVTGQFFNFSTVGQWMWDEISVSIPASPETYGKVALIHKAVLDETQQGAELAEQEWKRVPRKSGLSDVSASSSVNLRPAASGVDILVRYVTRASERLEVRNRLYERVIDVLHNPQVVISTSQPSKLTAAVLAAADSSEYRPRDKRASVYT